MIEMPENNDSKFKKVFGLFKGKKKTETTPEKSTPKKIRIPRAAKVTNIKGKMPNRIKSLPAHELRDFFEINIAVYLTPSVQ